MGKNSESAIFCPLHTGYDVFYYRPAISLDFSSPALEQLSGLDPVMA
jgi:hypothetical protein